MEIELFEKILMQLDNKDKLFYGYELSMDNGRPKMLGMGGFSYVYEMVSKESREKSYALKVFGVSKHNVTSDQFFDTIRIQKILMSKTPYVVELIDYLELEINVGEYGLIKLQFLLMEKVSEIIHKDKFKNVSLLRQELLEEKNVIKFAFEVGQTLNEAHNNKILHRDIKLENIFWDEEKECYKVGDFGVSRFIEEGVAKTQVMTTGYGAPEIEKPSLNGYNETSDIYSFGITLYLLLNDLKFPGSTGYYASAVQYNPDFSFPAPANASAEMSRIINKMSQYYSEDRYQSIAEVLADISILTEERDKECEYSDVLPDIETVIFRDNVDEKIERSFFIKGRALRKLNEKERDKKYKKISLGYTLIMTIFSLLVIGGMKNCIPLLAIALFSYTPAVMISTGVASVIWVVLDYTNKSSWLTWSGEKDFLWIIILLYLLLLYLYFVQRISLKKISEVGAKVGIWLVDKGPLIVMLIGLIFFILNKTGLVMIPELINRLHLFRIGACFFGFMLINVWIYNSEKVDENVRMDKEDN